MATKLYFCSTNASTLISGTLPSGEQSTASDDFGGTLGLVNRTLLDTVAVGNNGFSLSSVASVAAKKYNFGVFCSLPLGIAATVGAGSILLGIDSKEANLNANHRLNAVNIYIWRPSTGTKVGTIKDHPGAGAGVSTAEPAAIDKYYSNYWSFTGTGVAAQIGDIIVVEPWALNTQSSATAYTIAMGYQGTTEPSADGTDMGISPPKAFVQFTENLTFQASINSGDGAAAMALTVGATGRTVAGAAGSAAMTLTVAGAAKNYVGGAGAATCGLTVDGVGTAIVPAQGDIAALLQASGVWDLSSVIVEGVGEAAIISEITGEGQRYFPHVFAPEAPAGDGWTKEVPL